jgi:hypothetical protein
MNTKLSNAINSTISKWQTFKPEVNAELHQSMWDHDFLYDQRSSKDECLLFIPVVFFLKTKKYER